MEKKIDIIIPAYEAHDTMARCLSSIAMQTIAEDIQVTIINDCSPSGSYKNIIKAFKGILDIQEFILEENGGPAVARQYGMDHTTCPYLMFLDADDTLMGACTLRVMLNYIIDNRACALYGHFLREQPDGSMFIYNRGNTFLHGKIYDRSFLKQYNIHFNTERLFEDNFFQTQIDFCTQQLQLPVIEFEEMAMTYHYSPNGLYNGVTNEKYRSVMLEAWIINTLQLLLKLENDNLYDLDRFKNLFIVELYLDYNFTVQCNPDFTNRLLELSQEVVEKLQFTTVDISLCEKMYIDIIHDNDVALIMGTDIRDFVTPVIGFQEYLANILGVTYE